MTTHTLLVRKAALPDTRWQQQANAALTPGQIRLQVNLFSLTANNITHAAMGEAMNHWVSSMPARARLR